MLIFQKGIQKFYDGFEMMGSQNIVHIFSLIKISFASQKMKEKKKHWAGLI